ncbi:glutamate 5-kinase [Candidatus Woesearchaeota archaeon]|nr:glutamate 5-kinase [Candidatus Woesearchaeota archaeon]
MEALKGRIRNAKRVVIKIGTFVISKNEGGIDNDYICEIARQLSKYGGKEFILITSGAIGKGMNEIGLKDFPRDIKLRQACAAVGQTLLMNAYHEAFKKYGLKVAQLLLTNDSFTSRASYINLRNTFEKLIKLKVIPIVNENDPVSLAEIGKGFGDNDRLSALVASKIDADLLVMLSSAKGLYESIPRKGEKERIIKVVHGITPDIKSMAGKAGKFGLGGMSSKLASIEMAADAGIPVVVAYGRSDNVISGVFDGTYEGTLFVPKQKVPNKKTWVKITPSMGILIVDSGAKDALKNGRNLLPAGIVDVKGSFGKGDIVDIMADSVLIAKAISDFSADDIKKMKGKKSKDVKTIPGHINITRRENMVIM